MYFFYIYSPLFDLLSLFFSLQFRCKFFSLTETPEDYTIIVDEEGFKGEPRFVDTNLWSHCGNQRPGGKRRSHCVIYDSHQHRAASADTVWAHFVIIDVRPSCCSLCWLSEWIRVITHPSPGWASLVTLETTGYLLRNWCRYFLLVAGSVGYCLSYIELNYIVKLNHTGNPQEDAYYISVCMLIMDN